MFSIDKNPHVLSALNAVNSAYKMVSGEFSVLLLATGNIIKGLEGVGAIASGNPAIKMGLSIAGLVKSSFEAISTIPKASAISSFRSDLFEHVKDPDATATRQARIENLTQALSHIRDNEKSIRKTLIIAKEAGLVSRSNEALAGIGSTSRQEQDEALEKGELFIRQLRRRVDIKFGLSIAQLITKVSSVAVSISLVAAPPNPVTLSLAGVVGVATFALWGIEKIMVAKDPFGEPKDVWYEKVPHEIRTAVYKVSDAVKDFFSYKKPFLQPLFG